MHTFIEREKAKRAVRLGADTLLPASLVKELLDERVSMTELEETLGDLEEAHQEAVSFRDALDRIHALMGGREWTADTLDAIAEVLHASGYAIHDGEDVTLPGVDYTER